MGPPLPRSGGRQSHPASEAAGYTHGTRFRCQTTRQTLETSQGNQPQRPDVPQGRDVLGFPSPNAITGGNVCERDTPFQQLALNVQPMPALGQHGELEPLNGVRAMRLKPVTPADALLGAPAFERFSAARLLRRECHHFE